MVTAFVLSGGGGIADNAAVSQAVRLGADVVYVLPTGYACALDKAPASPLASALHALTSSSNA